MHSYIIPVMGNHEWSREIDKQAKEVLALKG